MIERALLLVSPTAGGGRALGRLPVVRDSLIAAGVSVDVVETESLEHAAGVARAAGPDALVCSLGGDGLHGAVAAGVADGGGVCAPLPGGRGNDLVRALGQSADPALAVQRLTVARERRIDVGVVEVAGAVGMPDAARRVFLGVASAGYDTEANRIANEATWLRAGLVYAYGGVRGLAANHPRTFRLVVDGVAREVRALNIAVGLSGWYGGGIHVCPDALVDDGLLDLLVVHDMPLPRFVATLVRELRGRHTGMKGVESRRVRSVEISCDEPLVMYADGDPVGELPARITVRPASLRVLA